MELQTLFSYLNIYIKKTNKSMKFPRFDRRGGGGWVSTGLRLSRQKGYGDTITGRVIKVYVSPRDETNNDRPLY